MQRMANIKAFTLCLKWVEHCPQHKQLVSAQPPGMGGLVLLCGNTYGQVKAEIWKGEHECTWRRMELVTLPA